MAEHSRVELGGRMPVCVFIGGTGRIEFELENGQLASVACDVHPKPEREPEPELNLSEEFKIPAPLAEEQEKEEAPEKPKPLRGKLPETFPGFKALSEHEPPITTYAQLRKERDTHDQSLTHVVGIAEATDLKIQEALEDVSPSEVSDEDSGEAAKE